MNYQAVEETIKAGYRAVSPQYRRDDEIEVTTENHRRLSAILRGICQEFPHSIRVLDVGCGTGRYFHCLRNVRELVGVDITEEMLQAAEHPVREEALTVPNIRLVRANIYLAEFPPESFQFIYSLGMFGNGCPVTTDLCNKFYQWLTPGGKLFFNTVDVSGLPLWYRARRRARRVVYSVVTPGLRKILDERNARHPFFGLAHHELTELMRASRFTRFEIQSRQCQSPLWSGRHLECTASK